MPKQSKANQSPESLKNAAQEMENAAADLRALAETIHDQKLDGVELTHYDAFVMGIQKLLSFSGAAKKKLFTSREQRGDFKSKEAMSDMSDSPKKGPKNKGLRS